jgi:hypothetical protein
LWHLEIRTRGISDKSSVFVNNSDSTSLLVVHQAEGIDGGGGLGHRNDWPGSKMQLLDLKANRTVLSTTEKKETKKRSLI